MMDNTEHWRNLLIQIEKSQRIFTYDLNMDGQSLWLALFAKTIENDNGEVKSILFDVELKNSRTRVDICKVNCHRIRLNS